MSSHSIEGHSPRSHQGRDAILDLDLNRASPVANDEQEGLDVNRAPSGANPEQEGPSIPSESHGVQSVQQPQFMQPIDDEVIEITQSAFVEARNNSRRNRGRTIVDVDLDNVSWMTEISPKKPRRDSLYQGVPNTDLCLSLGGSSSSEKGKNIMLPEPPKEPVFHCPICTNPIVEETLTMCGHVFCKKCIKDAIKAAGKCPTCGQSIAARGLRRVFLPPASYPEK